MRAGEEGEGGKKVRGYENREQGRRYGLSVPAAYSADACVAAEGDGSVSWVFCAVGRSIRR